MLERFIKCCPSLVHTVRPPLEDNLQKGSEHLGTNVLALEMRALSLFPPCSLLWPLALWVGELKNGDEEPKVNKQLAWIAPWC